MSKVNIVIIGAGEIAARRHIPALLQENTPISMEY